MTTLGAWSAPATSIAEVLSVLDELRRPEAMPATRTSVLTLVIVARRPESAGRAQEALHGLGGHHPARVLTLSLGPDDAPAGAALGARVRLLGSAAGDREVWFEDVELDVRGPVADHLHSLIEPLTLSDLPVVAWFVDELPEPDDPLLSAADVLLVDARILGADCFPTLASLVDRHPVVDLSWVRLQPWRELLAGLFEGPDFRPFVHAVRRAEVSGRTGPRRLLGGWIGERLALPPSSVVLGEAEHVSIRLDAEGPQGRHGRFEVARVDGGRTVRARADIGGGPTSEAVVQLPEATPAWGLADALSRLDRDPVYERALRRALP